jgi:HEAT repeat protein
MQQTNQTAKPAPPPSMVDSKYGTALQIRARKPAELVAILQDPQGSVYAKAKACQKLAVTGDATAVPALKALLGDAQLSHYARTALETNPSPTAGAALRAALSELKGKLLVGVINSIGVRRDRAAIDALAVLTADDDVEVVAAAVAALGRVRPPL